MNITVEEIIDDALRFCCDEFDFNQNKEHWNNSKLLTQEELIYLDAFYERAIKNLKL
jgi:hypothetical protein